MKRRVGLYLLLCALAAVGCRSASYWAWEKMGVYKRDLLKKNVVAARNDQKAASEQFKDALTRLKELTGFQGGNLEKTYNSLNRDYERSVERANAVHQRVRDVETVASDLFKEWEKENKEISSADLRDKSRQQLLETRHRYDDLHAALKRAEESMDPVLRRLRDQVLFLKHNLNAAAIASLTGESANIQTEIGKLISDMNAAIAEADKFINTMP
jgi:hypothetical protein